MKGLLAVLFAALVCYLPALSNGFVQDDHPAVESSPVVARGSLREIFSTDYWGDIKGNDRSLYRPVTVASWAGERLVSGRPSAALSHGVSVALHALASLLLLVLARRVLPERGALAAALLFAVHPVHVEAVAYIAARADILAALFTLAALVVHSAPAAVATSPPGSPSRGRAADWARATGTAICVFLGVASKEIAIVAPVLLVVWDLLFRPPRRGGTRAWIVNRATALAPTALAVGTYLFLRTQVLGGAARIQEINSTDNRLILLDGSERLATALGLGARYLRLFLAPIGLSADRSGGVIEPEPGLLGGRAILGLAILASALLLALLPPLRAYLSPERARTGLPERALAASFGAWLFLLPYLPGSNVLFLVRATVAERVLYLPSAGLCIVAGVLLGFGESRLSARRAVNATFALVLAVLAVATWRQCRVWKSDETTFSGALRSAPKSPRAAFILGKVKAEQGKHDEALAYFERARTVWPDFVGAWVNAATELARAGRPAEAEARLREAIARQPEFGGAHHNLGLVLRKTGRAAEAERSLRKATVYDPSLHRAWAELGHLRFEGGRYAEAADAYEQAVGLGRQDLVPRLRDARARPRTP